VGDFRKTQQNYKPCTFVTAFVMGGLRHSLLGQTQTTTRPTQAATTGVIMIKKFFWPLVFVFLSAVAGHAQGGDCAFNITPTNLEKAVASTFAIHSNDLEETLLGSGFAFYRPGMVLTNAHVVNGAKTVLLIAQDGGRQIAQVLARDVLRDIAVLHLAHNPAPIPAVAGTACLGQPVYAVGAPFGADFSVSFGIVSRLQRQIEPNAPVLMLQHDAALNPGSSGGPLVDANGALLGMNSQIADGFRQYIGISYAIPTALLNRTIAAMLAQTIPASPKLGLSLRPVDARVVAALGLKSRIGVLVDFVTADSLSARAGVLPGDIITAIAGQTIRKPGDIAFALDQAAGSRFDMTVNRAGRDHSLRVTVPSGAALGTDKPASPQHKTAYSFGEIGLDIDASGALKTVTPDSLGQFVGLAAADRIIAVNGQPANAALLREFRITGPVLLLVQLSDRSTKHFIVDPWHKPARMRPLGGANVLDTDVVIF